MPVTHVPAKPAVTKIVEVSPATPEKYVLELTLHQALCLAALSGGTGGPIDADDGGLWSALNEHPLYAGYRAERERALDEGRTICFKDLTVAEDQPDEALPPPPPGHIRVRRVVPGTDWIVGKVYTVDMSRNISGGSYPGVVRDEAGDKRVYFPEAFERV